MMNVKSFVVGIFSRGIRQHLNGQLDQIKQAAREDAAIVVGTYLDEFEMTAGQMLASRQRRLIGCDPEREEKESPAAATETGLERQLKASIRVVNSKKAK